jgi:hypothetical protein
MQKKGHIIGQVKVLELERANGKKKYGVSDPKEQIKNRCPECNNQVFFLEAGFLCPTCGYSMETLYS